MDKLKVVWLCHFSNEEVKNILKPNKNIKEFAPWMPLAISTIENCKDLEVHVVSPYISIKELSEFTLRGVHYHFFPALTKIPYKLFYNRYFRWDAITNFSSERKSINKIINGIHPDIIHLFGAENPYYSAAILDNIDKYPAILTVQGFASNSPRLVGFDKTRSKIEQKIIKKMSSAFYESKVQANDIRKYNKDIDLTWHFYGSYEITRPASTAPIENDIVFFARIEKDKGIVDLLHAIKIIRQDKPDVSLIVIGGGNISEFVKLAKELDIEDNVKWLGFQKTRQDVHKKAITAKISVLPTYHDINPGTIIESMFLNIPVVSYNVGTNPEVNEYDECIKLVPKGNIEELANAILTLLDDASYREKLAEKANKRAYEMYAPSKDVSVGCLMTGYNKAINLYRKTRHDNEADQK